MRKQNRNMVVEATGHVPVLDDFRWLTLAEIKALLAMDDLVNMDARTVLSCLSYADHGLDGYYADRSLEAEDDVEFLGRRLEGFQKDLLVSLLRRKRACHTLDELLSWYAEMTVQLRSGDRGAAPLEHARLAAHGRRDSS